MRFHLTYDGLLLASNKSKPRATHKQQIRKHFHHQLKLLWSINPFLQQAKYGHFTSDTVFDQNGKADEELAKRFALGKYKFVPLILEDTSLLCSLDVVFLRPEIPGKIISSGDIDGRLKTIFDALTKPGNISELGSKYQEPEPGETPFYCLLENDKLVSRFSVSTDTLLEPTHQATGKCRAVNDARLLIEVCVQPYVTGLGNIGFGC